MLSNHHLKNRRGKSVNWINYNNEGRLFSAHFLFSASDSQTKLSGDHLSFLYTHWLPSSGNLTPGLPAYIVLTKTQDPDYNMPWYSVKETALNVNKHVTIAGGEIHFPIFPSLPRLCLQGTQKVLLSWRSHWFKVYTELRVLTQHNTKPPQSL